MIEKMMISEEEKDMIAMQHTFVAKYDENNREVIKSSMLAFGSLATDTAVALGIKPVGVVESWREKPTYKYLRDDLQDVKIVGQETQPNLEQIAELIQI